MPTKSSAAMPTKSSAAKSATSKSSPKKSSSAKSAASKSPSVDKTKPRGRPKGSKDKKPRKQRSWEDTPSIIRDANPILPEGYNSNRIQFQMEIMPTEPLDPHDVPEMERRFKHYLEMCVKYDQKVGNLAAYMAIGIDKEQAMDWEKRTSDRARSGFIKTVRKFCATYRESLMSDGKVNPVTGIFWQKNYDGLRDQTEISVAQSPALGAEPDKQELAARIESAVVIDLPPAGATEGTTGVEIPTEQAEPVGSAAQTAPEGQQGVFVPGMDD